MALSLAFFFIYLNSLHLFRRSRTSKTKTQRPTQHTAHRPRHQDQKHSQDQDLNTKTPRHQGTNGQRAKPRYLDQHQGNTGSYFYQSSSGGASFFFLLSTINFMNMSKSNTAFTASRRKRARPKGLESASISCAGSEWSGYRFWVRVMHGVRAEG